VAAESVEARVPRVPRPVGIVLGTVVSTVICNAVGRSLAPQAGCSVVSIGVAAGVDNHAWVDALMASSVCNVGGGDGGKRLASMVTFSHVMASSMLCEASQVL